MEVFDYMNKYYENFDEDNRFAQKHGQVEYLTTMRYIQKYLSPGDKVLEIGAGTGTYSISIGRLGININAIELIPHNINIL